MDAPRLAFLGSVSQVVKRTLVRGPWRLQSSSLELLKALSRSLTPVRMFRQRDASILYECKVFNIT